MENGIAGQMQRLRWSAYLAYHLRGQARYPFRPLPAILADQARRVRAIVAYAYRHVPYYREALARLGLRPADFQSAADLTKLPLLEGDELRRDPERFVSTAHPLERYLQLRSGGSTGKSRIVYHSADAVLQNAAQGERERSIITRLLGQRFGYREAIIASSIGVADKVQHFCRERTLFPGRLGIQRHFLSILDAPEENARLLDEFKPDVIQTYGSYLSVLLPYLEATGQPYHRPAVITYNSDGCSPSVRRRIEERCGIPVFSTYQAIEAFKIGFECEHHLGLHLNLDLYPARIVDAYGRSLPKGESGDVVVSNLVNRGTVLLNYRLGDIASLLPDACPCGRRLPLLSFVHGRSGDLIDLPSGRIVHPMAVRTIFTYESQVLEYQVVQQSLSEFTVAILAASDCDREQTRQRVAAKFAERLGADIAVTISFVDSVDRTIGGKFRPVVSLRTRIDGSGQPLESDL